MFKKLLGIVLALLIFAPIAIAVDDVTPCVEKVPASYKMEWTVSTVECTDGYTASFLYRNDEARIQARLKAHGMPPIVEFWNTGDKNLDGERIYYVRAMFGFFVLPFGYMSEDQIETVIPGFNELPDSLLDHLVVGVTAMGFEDIFINLLFDDAVGEDDFVAFIGVLYDAEFERLNTGSEIR